MKKEINNKEKNLNNNINNKDIILLSEITNNSYVFRDLDNTFIIFKSFDKILYLIYSTKKLSIISYNLNEFKIITEIKNPHENNSITNFRHFFDKDKNKDLIMTISSKINNIRIWENKNWNCILNIKNIYQNGIINSACFIYYNNNIYIAASNNNFNQPDFIKIINFNGKIITEIKNSLENTYFIDSYYNKDDSKLYIISGNYDYIKSYDYINNELYHKYFDNKSKYHCSIKIKQNKEITRLIESSGDGIVRIWNFHSGLLISKIYVSNLSLYGLCFLDDDNIFVGCADNSIKLININSEEIVKNITGFNNWICTINKIYHDKYGNCIITQGVRDEQIKMWIIKSK